MVPTLLPGDRVLVWRSAGPLKPQIRVGDLVAVVDPRDPGRVMVKRLAGVTGTEVSVLGDNEAASTDSRHFGPLSPTAIVGRVVYRYLPEERRGRLRTRR
jgi:nickel-type superoxide dismutase maturation protease